MVSHLSNQKNSYFKALICVQNVFTCFVEYLFHLQLQLKRDVQQAGFPRKRLTSGSPKVGLRIIVVAFKGEITLITGIGQGTHDLVHIDRSHKGQNMIVITAAVVVYVHSPQFISQIQNALVLVTLQIAVTGIPTGVEQRVVGILQKSAHFVAGKEMIFLIHVGFCTVFDQDIDIVLFHCGEQCLQKWHVFFEITLFIFGVIQNILP